MAMESSSSELEPPAIGRQPSDVVGDALSSWQRTLRLCVLLLAASPVAGVMLVVLLAARQ